MPDASGLQWRRPPSAPRILGAMGVLPQSRRGGVLSIAKVLLRPSQVPSSANGLLRPGRGEGEKERACLMLRACYGGGPRVPPES